VSWRRIVARLRSLGHGSDRRADIDDEIASHVGLLEDEYRAEGLSASDARDAARRDFGSLAFVGERTAEAWRFSWLDDLVRDLFFGLRMMWRHRAIAAIVMVVMTVGIGSSTAMFSLVDACLLRSIISQDGRPFHNVDDRWSVIQARLADGSISNYFSVAEFADVARLTDVFEETGAVAGTTFALSEGDFPEQVHGTYVTANVLSMLHVPPVVGRLFRADEDRAGGPDVAVISYRLWQTKLGGRPDVLTRTITLNRRQYAIVGVMPPHFDLWGGWVWLPFQLDMADRDRTNQRFWITTLLQPGVSQAAADARLRVLAVTLARDHRDIRPDYAGMNLTIWNIREAVLGAIKPAMFVLVLAVALLLLIACTNIANLLLARATARAREMSIRTALGAGRLRLVRQMLAESVLLSVAGGVGGVGLAAAVIPTIVHLIPPEYLTTDADLVRVDLTAVLVATGLSIAAGLVFGIVPAVRAGSRTWSNGLGLRGGGDGRARRVQQLLSFVEIALTLVVAVAASLMIRSYRAAERVALGFDPDGLLSFRVMVPPARYDSPQKIAAFYERALARLASAAGVDGIAAVTDRPLGYRTVDLVSFAVTVDGHPARDGAALPTAVFRVVSPGYQRVVGTPIVRGREFTDADAAGQPAVAVVNETMAQTFWPGEDAVGQTLHLGARFGRGNPQTPPHDQIARVVGIVRDSKQVRAIDASVRPELFLPLGQRPEEARSTAVLVRTAGNPAQVVKALRTAMADVDPDMPIYDVDTMQNVVADAFGPKRLTLVLLLFFATVAIALAAVGLYGIVSFAVEQRARELSVRAAIGASPRAIVALVLGDAASVACAGVVAGAAAALAATRVMSSELSGVSATDPAMFALAAGSLLIVALSAAAVPACRASRADPLIALRSE
jgi:putative ABC transport system permease protein